MILLDANIQLYDIPLSSLHTADSAYLRVMRMRLLARRAFTVPIGSVGSLISIAALAAILPLWRATQIDAVRNLHSD